MRTLDRYVIRSFLTSAILLLVAVMAIRIVSDLFFNMDEFVEGDEPFAVMVQHIVEYYSYQSLIYFSELGGVVIVIAAAFTLAKMNHTNELTAMLASGVSLHRVIVPMVVSAILMGGLIVLDRELLIPPNAARLVRTRDETSQNRRFPIQLVADGNGTIWYSHLFEPRTGRAEDPILTIRTTDRRRLASIVSGGEATPATLVDHTGRKWVGWDITQAALARASGGRNPWPHTPDVNRVYTQIGPNQLLDAAKDLARANNIAVPPDSEIPSVSGIPPTHDPQYGLTIATRCPADQYELVRDPYVPHQPGEPGKPRGGRLTQPLFFYQTAPHKTPGGQKEPARTLGIFHAESAVWMPGDAPGKSHWQLNGGRLFFPSDLKPEELVLRQSSKWLDLMSTPELTRLLKLNRIPDREAAMLAKHVRFADPFSNLIMLLLALPFILSRERNIKASASFSVLMVGCYFAFVHICRLVGLQPMLAAFLPVVLFGTIAAVMLDAVKT